MRLSDVKESKQQSIPPAEYTRSITLLIRDHIYHLEGLWEWDMHCQAVFCSDVLASPPRDFEGARAILFPDDVEKLLDDLNAGVPVFAFRIITSYGTVKQVQGSGITISEREMIATDAGPTAREMLLQAENRQLRFLNEIYEETEHTTQNAIWYYNVVTRETWYSNQYYRLHEIAPQSLNAHLNTFTAFIHTDDQELVMEFRDKSYKERTPLHLVYRIVTQTGVKYLWYRTDWRFNDRGESVLFGSILDITEQQEEDRLLEQSGNEALFNRQLLLQDEQAANLGHWHMNLYTRKMEFSDMVFRLHGVKSNTLRPGLNAFINFVHQEDRDAYATAMKLMVTHHTPPDLEYRIIRSDGKTRHLSQKAKLITSGMELVMACTIQDITVQRQLEKRLQEQTEAAGIQSFVYGQVEEMAKVGSWVWDIESGHIDWSDSLYTLLGLKPRSVELT
ncbi:MAG TPA: PAS domain-containing protein, partial [Flavisolibacter sp.]|nr:PAS domain-containing protein [Flavisolibacter sp.]